MVIGVNSLVMRVVKELCMTGMAACVVLNLLTVSLERTTLLVLINVQLRMS